MLDLVRHLRRELLEALVESRRTGTTVPVSKIVQRSLKTFAAEWPTAGSWACAQGCAFCCHNAASVSAPEAFRLADAVRRLPPAEAEALTEAVRARAEAVRGLSLDEQSRRRTPCALLGAGDACRLHAARPLPCIGLVSMDRSACEQVFREERPRAKIPVDRVFFSVAGAHNLALRLASRDAGLGARRYELHEALALALADPGAQARWLAGEDPFAGCRPDPTSVGKRAEANLQHMDALTR